MYKYFDGIPNKVNTQLKVMPTTGPFYVYAHIPSLARRTRKYGYEINNA